MNVYHKLTFLIIILVFFSLFIVLPKNTLAEIATTRDWIGLFQITNPVKGDAKTDTVNRNSWGYPSNRNAATGICAQTPGTTPQLSDTDGCKFNLSLAPGDYEFRLYAYDSDTLLARSRKMTAGAVDPGAGGGATKGNNNCENHSTVQNGLISATDITRSGSTFGNDFGNDIGICVVDNKAAFAPYKIPTYDDLKSLYYTQSKATKTTSTGSNQGSLRSALNNNDIVLFTGDLNLSGNLGGTNKTAVVFVEGNLTFSRAFTFGDANTGVVFVVKGNVNIDKDVTRIDAVIISQGIIYTAGAGCSLAANTGTNSQLVVNGSLISIESGSINFCRKTANDSLPAEKIIQQPKYLVILRNLMSDTWQKWSEVQ